MGGGRGRFWKIISLHDKRDKCFQFTLNLTIPLPSCLKCECRCNTRCTSSHVANKREKPRNCRVMNPDITGLVKQCQP